MTEGMNRRMEDARLLALEEKVGHVSEGLIRVEALENANARRLDSIESGMDRLRETAHSIKNTLAAMEMTHNVVENLVDSVEELTGDVALVKIEAARFQEKQRIAEWGIRGLIGAGGAIVTYIINGGKMD